MIFYVWICVLFSGCFILLFVITPRKITLQNDTTLKNTIIAHFLYAYVLYCNTNELKSFHAKVHNNYSQSSIYPNYLNRQDPDNLCIFCNDNYFAVF